MSKCDWPVRIALMGLALLAILPLAMQMQSQSGGSTVAYNIPDRGGTSLLSDGVGTSTRVGYTVIQPNASLMPAGVAIFGFRQNNVLITEAGVPASPLIQSGRIYAEVNGSVNTGIAIANPNNQAAAISFYFTSAAGGGTGAFTLPANGQIAKFLNEAPFNAPSSLTGTFTFSSSVPIAAIALRGFTNERSEFLITTLPIASLTGGTGQNVIFPHFADGGGWTTQVILVNPTDDTLSGLVQFFDQGTATAAAQPASVSIDGQMGSSFPYTIAPRSSRRFQTSGSGGTTQVGSVRVFPASATKAPSGVSIFSLRTGGITVTQAGVPVTDPSPGFRLYAQVSGVNGRPGSIQTGVAIANPASTAVGVTFELNTLDGTATGLTGTATIPAGGQTATFLNQIKGFESLPTSFEGVLRITTASFSGLAVTGLRSRYNERGDFLITTTPPVTEFAGTASPSLMVFPHLVDGAGYTTQFILYKPYDVPAAGTLRFLSQAGDALSLSLHATNSSSLSCASPVTSATLATGVSDPLAVAVDSTYVYFGNTHGKLQRVPKAGGAVVTLATVPGMAVSGIAVDDTTIYFGTAARDLFGFGFSSIRSLSKDGGEQKVLANGLNNPIQVAADSLYVYWSAIGSMSGAGLNSNGSIQRVAKAGGNVETLASNLSAPLGLALDGNDVYFGELGISISPPPFSGIRKVSKTGGPVSSITDAVPGGFVTTDETSVYFSSVRLLTDTLAGGLFRVAKSGGRPVLLPAKMSLPVQVIFYDGKLYSGGINADTADNGSIQASDNAGGSLKVLKAPLSWAGLFAIDPCAVYGSSKNNGGSIERISR